MDIIIPTRLNDEFNPLSNKIQIENLAILGYYGSANTGDEAILHCLLHVISKNFPNLNISVFSSDAIHTQKHHKVNAVQSSLPNRLFDMALRSLGRNRKNFYNTLSAFINADVLLVGGGGLFHDSPESNRHCLNMLQKISWAKRLGARVAVLGVTVGPLHLEQTKRRIREVFGQVDLITVREQQSKDLLSDIGLFHPKLFVTSDVVYLLESAGRQRILEIAENEGLNLNCSPKIAVCLCAYEKIRQERLRSIAFFCDYAISQLGAQIWFIPMQTSAEHDDRDEAKTVLSLMQNRDSARCINGEYSPREILGLIGETHAVLAERLHGSIMAINANVPCFGIGYSPKVTWLFDKIGYPQHHISSNDLSPNRLVAGFSRLWNKRERVRQDLKVISQGLKSAAMDNFHHFKRDLVTDYVKSA